MSSADQVDQVEPAKKKAKSSTNEGDGNNNTSNSKQQSSLLSFFASSSSKKKQEEPFHKCFNEQSNEQSKKPGPLSSIAVEKAVGGTNDGLNECGTESLAPIVPTKVSAPQSISYQSLHNNHVIVRKPGGLLSKKGAVTRTKVAAFDLDGTLMQWTINVPGFWPNQLAHFEVWNARVIPKLRSLYDDGYLVVIFTNQGGIQSAHSGKKATMVKDLLDFLEHKVGRPLCAVMSTKSPKKSQDTFHKPKPDMWTKILANGVFQKQPMDGGGENSGPDVTQSFFVGDSADEDDPQGGVDKKFAESVGLQFFTPDDFFGPSSQELRQKTTQLEAGGGAKPPPTDALKARSALLGGYLRGPIVLILAGAQGSGKSTFCEHLITGGIAENKDENDETDHHRTNSNGHWVHLSQDTINKGKPGKRELVEAEARKALQEGNSVVIDRMHLDPEQRKYFVELAQEEHVPAHIVVLNPPKHVVSTRVKNRLNHPGKVQGESGVRLALQSMDRLVMPSYEENVQLISCASTSSAAIQLALRYAACVAPHNGGSNKTTARLFVDRVPLTVSGGERNDDDNLTLTLPVITLGTMKMGRRTCGETVSKMIASGFEAVDTAPTYNNEDKVGEALQNTDQKENIVVIAKVPKRAVQPADVKSELATTLQNLKRESVDLLLLHWPSDVMAAITLQDVWKCMESCCKEGKCKALGVSNFNQAALSELLRVCTIPPVVNQVERHPLLSQMDLVDFCARHNITIQAHTPLGQGMESLLSNPVVKQVARESGLSAAQVVVQWNLQQGMCVVPKCSQESHAKELLDLLDSKKAGRNSSDSLLTPDQMKALDSLDSGTRYVVAPFMYGRAPYCWGEHMPRR